MLGNGRCGFNLAYYIHIEILLYTCSDVYTLLPCEHDIFFTISPYFPHVYYGTFQLSVTSFLKKVKIQNHHVCKQNI